MGVTVGVIVRVAVGVNVGVLVDIAGGSKDGVLVAVLEGPAFVVSHEVSRKQTTAKVISIGCLVRTIVYLYIQFLEGYCRLVGGERRIFRQPINASFDRRQGNAYHVRIRVMEDDPFRIQSQLLAIQNTHIYLRERIPMVHLSG